MLFFSARESIARVWMLTQGWSVDDEVQSEDAIQLQQPDMLVSVLAPVRCARQFTGRSHLLIGRYLPTDLAKKYDLCLPEYAGTDVFVEMRPLTSAIDHHVDGSTKSKKDGEDGPATKARNGDGE